MVDPRTVNTIAEGLYHIRPTYIRLAIINMDVGRENTTEMEAITVKKEKHDTMIKSIATVFIALPPIALILIIKKMSNF